MDLMVLNEKFETIYLVDAFQSLIWTDRYNQAGDFELYTEVSGEILKYVLKDYYLITKESEHAMIVEDIEIISDRELGNKIKITGSSLEKLIDRRIVWGLKVLNTTVQNGIKTLINNSIISPSDSNRKIDNFVFVDSSDPVVTSAKMNNQYTGDNLYDVVSDLCYVNDLGYKIVLNSLDQFEFSLYAGKDRSYDNIENPFVIFSPKYENLVNSNYYESNANLKNVTLIGGQGEGNERVYTTVGSGSGLNRREIFTDARDLSPNDISSSQYITNLQSRGNENLAENQETVTFEGEVEAKNSFIYKEDYYLGDIVQIENEYGLSGTTRITEVVTSIDDNGTSIYPTFEMIGMNKATETEEGGN